MASQHNQDRLAHLKTVLKTLRGLNVDINGLIAAQLIEDAEESMNADPEMREANKFAAAMMFAEDCLAADVVHAIEELEAD